MHTHNKTYLASLGFGDRDKQNPLHDLAGQYLGEQMVGEHLMRVFNPYPKRQEWEEANPVCGSVVHQISECRYQGALLEQPLVKGTGQYRTYVGFLDVLLMWVWKESVTPRVPCERHSVFPGRCFFSVWVEVKINPVPLGDVLRQITLYKTFLEESNYKEANGWALVTYYDLSTYDVELLKEKGIKHIRLGTDFDHYCEWRRQNNQPSPDSVII